jgi:3-oxosteroid 1-dehydrogenase
LGWYGPNGIGLKNAIKIGYVKTANTIKDLSTLINVPFDELSKTISSINNYAKTGRDLDFKKGEDAYQINLGRHES